jgi:hypothetical protein
MHTKVQELMNSSIGSLSFSEKFKNTTHENGYYILRELMEELAAFITVARGGDAR